MWRMNILGTLVSARLEHGDRQELLEEAASRTYVTPDGRRVRFTWRTLEGWYYQYRGRGLTGLASIPRADTSGSTGRRSSAFLRRKRSRPCNKASASRAIKRSRVAPGFLIRNPRCRHANRQVPESRLGK